MGKNLTAAVALGLCLVCLVLLILSGVPSAPPTASPTGLSTAPNTIPTTPSSTGATTLATQEATRATAPTETASTESWAQLEAFLKSEYCYVLDGASGQLLLDLGGADTPVYPASITKLFSIYVAMQHLPLDTLVTTGWEVELIDPESSRAGIGVGYVLTVEQLIQGMMMCSGNDAAYALAGAVGRKLAAGANLTPRQAIERFVEEMNIQAQALGLTGTHFVTPDGIHDDAHYTTANDLFAIARLSMENPVIRRFAVMKEATVTLASGQELQWHNSNLLLYEEFPYYIPDALGLKTGTEDLAGHCLLSVFPKGEDYIYILVLKGSTFSDRYEDTLYLYQTYVQK